MRPSRWPSAALLALALAGARPALAQEIALPRFHPAFAGDRFLGVPSPYAAGDGVLHALALLDFARSPLVIRRDTDDVIVREIVGGQLLLHANVTYALWRRLALNVDLPAALVQAGDDAASRDAPDLGDLRLGARVRILGALDAPFQLGFGGYFWAPTGTGPFVTDRTARALPQLIAGGVAGRVVWSAALGPELRASQGYAGIHVGTALGGGAGAGVVLGEDRQAQVGAELIGAVTLVEPAPENLHAEVLLHARHRLAEVFEVGLGGGPGLGEGLGTPLYRVLGSLAYTPDLRERGSDGDRDGIPDVRDACPRLAGPARTDRARHGCPDYQPAPVRDADGDGVEDDADACPETPGIPRQDVTVDGCPLEEPARGAPGEGAPEAAPQGVRVEKDEIVLPRDIAFEVGKATLRPSEEALIHEVAELLLRSPEIVRVEVQGHTDFHGTLARNEKLAAARAEAVRQALIRHSVAPERITARVYGPSRPAEPNTTEAGRQRNRRVVIRILEQKGEGRAVD